MSQNLVIRDPSMQARAIALITRLDLEKPWEMILRPHKRSRSLEQNALYWKWLGIIAKDTGHDSEEIHEFCKQKFLEPIFVEINGEVHEARRTTTKLKVDEMSSYMNRVYAWATSELGILLPLPEDRLEAA